MLPSTDLKVAYLVKRYPRYSETFIVNEILAHERAGLSIEIFSLRPPVDTHFQDRIALVQSPVRYLTGTASKASAFWDQLREAANIFPDLWRHLDESSEASAAEVQQALILARHVRNSGIDHVHAHFATEPTTVARLAAKFAGVGYSFTAHAKDIFHEDASHDDRWQKLCDAAAVVTVSDFNREYLHETFGAAADRVRRIYNGIDLEALPYTPPAERKPVIAAVGRLVEKKGFDVLIDACGRLADEGVEFTCQIVGTGDLERRLRDQIARRGLEGHVQMLGPRPQEEVFALVRHAAVLAVPCVVGKDGNRDGLPTVLLEAMALGTPCVSTDVTGIPEVIRHRQTGLLARQGDPQSLAEGLKELLHDSALRFRLAESARELVEQDFEIDRNTEAMREMFRSAVLSDACPRPDSLREPIALQENV